MLHQHLWLFSVFIFKYFFFKSTNIIYFLLFELAFIPYPLIFGNIADASCKIWESRCGKSGNCWLYDQKKFRTFFHGGVAFFLTLGSIFDFAMIFYADRIKNFYGDEDDDDNNIDSDDGNNIDHESPPVMIQERNTRQLSRNFPPKSEMHEFSNQNMPKYQK